MFTTKPFTMIDFYESLSIIGAVNVDFDESYPHHTKKLNDWLIHWAPLLIAREESDMKTFYQALPTKILSCNVRGGGVAGSTEVYDNAKVGGHTKLYGSTHICNNTVLGARYRLASPTFYKDTIMSVKQPFTMIDFYDALSVIDLVKVDFDNSYPHHTQHLVDWEKKWFPHLMSHRSSPDYPFYLAMPLEKGLRVLNPSRGMVVDIHYPVDRPEVYLAMAMVIELSRCATFQALSSVLTHFCRDDWTTYHRELSLDTFLFAHCQAYNALGERT